MACVNHYSKWITACLRSADMAKCLLHNGLTRDNKTKDIEWRWIYQSGNMV